MDPSVWWYIGMMLASAFISYALAPKAQQPKPEAFADVQFPQADEGTPQCVVFGDCWSGDWTVLAYGDYRTEEIRGDGGK